MDWTQWRQALRARRRELGWTQQYLADRLEVEQSRISDWETGTSTPWATHFLVWARALGVTPVLTVGRVEEK